MVSSYFGLPDGHKNKPPSKKDVLNKCEHVPVTIHTHNVTPPLYIWQGSSS